MTAAMKRGSHLAIDRCLHSRTVEVQTSVGARTTVCRTCGAHHHTEYVDGWSVPLDAHITYMDLAGRRYPLGAYMEVLS